MPRLNQVFFRRLKFLIILVLGFSKFSSAQTDDLMFAEYVDWSSGSGWAVKIYNPTNSSINLSNYYLRIYRNGGTTFTENEQLSGTIGAKQTIIIGNDEYCDDECPGSCDIALATLGINGNEILELATASCTIDLIGAKGVDLGSQNGWTVDGTTKATYKKTLTRRSNNGIRYTKSDGIAPYSWPSDRSNFPGWNVSSVGCLSNGFSLSVVVPNTATGVKLDFNDSIICLGSSLVIGADKRTDWEILENGKTASNSADFNFNESTGTYTIVAKSQDCGGNDTCRVQVINGGQIKITGNTSVCQGGDLRFYTDFVGGNVWQNTTTIDTFILSNIQSDIEVTVENSTTGCGSAYDTVQVSVVNKYPNPDLPARIEFNKDSIIVLEDLHSTSGYTYSHWTYKGSLVTGNSISYTHDEKAQLCIILGPSIDCTDTMCTELVPKENFSLFIPNAITPNNDGLNDVFKFYIEGGELEQLEIYNRWGERLYESSRNDTAWDATYQQKIVPSSTYFYIGKVLNLNNNEVQTISGIVEVIP